MKGPNASRRRLLQAAGVGALNLAADNSGVSRPLSAGKPILDIFG